MAPQSMDEDLEKLLPRYDELSRPPSPAANPSESIPSSSSAPPLPANDLTTPAPEAHPAEVRAYLTELMTRRGVAAARAEQVAGLWTMGTGNELRTYPVGMFRDTFGTDGWVLYKEVKTRVYREEAKKSEDEGSDRGGGACLIMFLVMMAGVFGGGIALVAKKKPSTGWGVFMMILAWVGILLGAAGLASTHNKAEGAEKRAEDELKALWEQKTTK